MRLAELLAGYDRRSAVALGTLGVGYGAIALIWRDYLDWSRGMDWLLFWIWAFMTAVLCWGIRPRRDLIRAGVGLAGGLYVEAWGTQTEIWWYFTAERPPVWILPAWPVAVITIDRLGRALDLLLPAGRLAWGWWALLPPFVVGMTWFVWPYADRSLTVVSIAAMIGVLASRSVGQVRQDVVLMVAGAGLGLFLEYWGDQPALLDLLHPGGPPRRGGLRPWLRLGGVPAGGLGHRAGIAPDYRCFQRLIVDPVALRCPIPRGTTVGVSPRRDGRLGWRTGTMEANEIEAGTVLDRYTVEGVLGEGGMAVVFRVRHNQLGTLHALKVLSVPSRHIQQRMIQEGQVQATLGHPNIVGVTDMILLEGDTPGLIMEFVDGPTLEDLLFQRGVDLDQADVLARGILAGVAHAHAAGLIHRDLKPANILLEPQGKGYRAKVTDFGLAKVLSGPDSHGGRTRTGATMGTPQYMSPEQVRDAKNVGPAGDVFALGAILYEMVTRQRAFDGEDLLEVFNAVASGEFRPPRERVPRPARSHGGSDRRGSAGPPRGPAGRRRRAGPGVERRSECRRHPDRLPRPPAPGGAGPELRARSRAPLDPRSGGQHARTAVRVRAGARQEGGRDRVRRRGRGVAARLHRHRGAVGGVGGGVARAGGGRPRPPIRLGDRSSRDRRWTYSSRGRRCRPPAIPSRCRPSPRRPPPPPSPKPPQAAPAPRSEAPIRPRPESSPRPEPTVVGTEVPSIDDALVELDGEILVLDEAVPPSITPPQPTPASPEVPELGQFLASDEIAERKRGIDHLADRLHENEADLLLGRMVREDADAGVRRHAWRAVMTRWRRDEGDYHILQDIIGWQLANAAPREAVEAAKAMALRGNAPDLMAPGLSRGDMNVERASIAAVGRMLHRADASAWRSLLEPLQTSPDPEISAQAIALLDRL